MPAYELTVPPELDGAAIRKAATGLMGLSSRQFKRCKFQGEMRLDGQLVHADARLRTGQRLWLYAPERDVPQPEASQIPLQVFYEDEHLLIVNKPAPLPSASSQRQTGATLENVVYSYLGCPDGFVYRPVNRLDKGTSGLMVIAKEAHAQHLLQQLLHTDQFQRTYLAVVEGHMPEPKGVIDLPIAKEDAASIRRIVHPDGKEARTFYRVDMISKVRSLLWLQLDTGRTHQIRVHVSHLGCPICGDFLYGTELDELPGRFALHSTALKLWHPIKQCWLHYESPLPDELAALLTSADRPSMQAAPSAGNE